MGNADKLGRWGELRPGGIKKIFCLPKKNSVVPRGRFRNSGRFGRNRPPFGGAVISRIIHFCFRGGVRISPAITVGGPRRSEDYWRYPLARDERGDCKLSTERRLLTSDIPGTPEIERTSLRPSVERLKTQDDWGDVSRSWGDLADTPSRVGWYGKLSDVFIQDFLLF